LRLPPGRSNSLTRWSSRVPRDLKNTYRNWTAGRSARCHRDGMAVRKPVRSTVMVAPNGAEIEAAAGELAGRRLDGVRYYMTPQGHDGQAGLGRGRYARGRLRTRAGHAGRHDRDHLGAAREFGYGLQLGSGPLLNELARAEFCSVAAQAPWAAVLGKRITKARVHWLDVTWGSREPLARGPDAPVRRQHGHRGHASLRPIKRASSRGQSRAVPSTRA
jgi:hypothetical protein